MMNRKLLETAVRMAAEAAGIGEKVFEVAGLHCQAGLYEILLSCDGMLYTCYVDVLNGDVPGIESQPVSPYRLAGCGVA